MKKIKVSVSGGLGRMGSLLVKRVKRENSIKLVSVTEQRKIKRGNLVYERNSIKSLGNSDVIIDFTRPKCTMEILKIAVKLKKKIIIGTTGFSATQNKVIARAAKKTAILKSGNMSLGINIMKFLSKILSNKIIKKFQIEIHDEHHRHKVDYPSGTALMLGESIAEGRNANLRKLKGKIFLNKKGKVTRNKINFFIRRIGNARGIHSVIFRTPQEIIEIKHTAKTRDIFVDGAIDAVKWISKKRSGLYNMYDVLKIRDQ